MGMPLYTFTGCFTDISNVQLHQDGLVHISALSDTFVKDPHSVVKAGQIVKVKVLEVDTVRKRIALTMRLTDAATKPAREPQRKPQGTPQAKARPASQPVTSSAMAAAFAKLKR